jgi:hypothetical protein
MYTYHKQQALIEEQQVIDTNDIFDLAVIHPPHDEAKQFTTRHDTNHTRS